MDWKLYISQMANIKAQNKLLKFCFILIAGTQLWNSHKIDEAMHYQRTVLIPVGLDSRVTMTADHVSDNYVRTFAREVTNLAFNYNPVAARRQFGELLQYFTPEAFPQAKSAFDSLADTIERAKVSSSFVVAKDIEVDQEKKTITVNGTQRQWVESQFIDTADKTYILNYLMADGHFQLTSIEEKKSNMGQRQDVKPHATAATSVAGGLQNAKQ
jgi:type IV conjugative transfer system protein TraE